MDTQITYARAAEVLEYTPETGRFRWRIDKGTRARKGVSAGSINGHGYYTIQIDGVKYAAHRLAWLLTTGEWPTGEIDHINGLRYDNRVSNLRDVTRGQNLQNMYTQTSNSAGVRGVSRCPVSGMYRARVTVGGRTVHCGWYKSLESAIAARREAKLKLHTFTATEKGIS